MGSVRSDHVGQRRAVSAAAATSGAHSASGTASPGPPRHQPAATDSPLVGGGRGPEGRDAGTGRARASHPPAAALRRPGVGSPAVPPAAGRALGGDSERPATCDRWLLRLKETWTPPFTSGVGGGGI